MYKCLLERKHVCEEASKSKIHSPTGGMPLKSQIMNQHLHLFHYKSDNIKIDYCTKNNYKLDIE